MTFQQETHLMLWYDVAIQVRNWIGVGIPGIGNGIQCRSCCLNIGIKGSIQFQTMCGCANYGIDNGVEFGQYRFAYMYGKKLCVQ
jgi:hypothetical protein